MVVVACANQNIRNLKSSADISKYIDEDVDNMKRLGLVYFQKQQSDGGFE